MFIRYAGGTNLQASTPGLVNFLPCFAPSWVGKCTAAGTDAAGLCVSAAGHNVFHARFNGRGIVALPL